MNASLPGQGKGMRLGSLIVRGVVGPLFVGHGTQKLFGWFGGYGLEGTGGAFEGMGLRPGKRHATAAGVAEAGGGALLTLGLATPIAASAVAGTMVTAIRTAHGGKPPWVTEGGWEYCAVIIAAMAALAEAGPGPLSVDAKKFPNFHGPGLALAALALAVAGSYAGTSPPLNEPAPVETPAAPAA